MSEITTNIINLLLLCSVFINIICIFTMRDQHEVIKTMNTMANQMTNDLKNHIEILEHARHVLKQGNLHEE